MLQTHTMETITKQKLRGLKEFIRIHIAIPGIFFFSISFNCNLNLRTITGSLSHLINVHQFLLEMEIRPHPIDTINGTKRISM